MDHYKKNLKNAAWNWMETQAVERKKDRRSGRAEKRSARQADRREINKEIR